MSACAHLTSIFTWHVCICVFFSFFVLFLCKINRLSNYSISFLCVEVLLGLHYIHRVNVFNYWVWQIKYVSIVFFDILQSPNRFPQFNFKLSLTVLFLHIPIATPRIVLLCCHTKVHTLDIHFTPTFWCEWELLILFIG